ncbi:uncharacterized protein A4U43_C04F21790 [Asparagus officinalis]|uniref:Cyanobacterial aminoacyl-tRNA synthetase CAAD domain-containing protein n=1 Tax=Asparagus officinalis TaxID=4686 RepID=A0A5P1F4K1_ASPOF|nr:protein CURVATURE THYLAKOID 1B, chloroplastic-like [Asparagus officinalis]ONK72663.1 uncharacterized protein A4U43_C04F21790 [Asparagus officinalis]
MASTATAATCALASPSLGVEGRAAAAPHSVGLPALHAPTNLASLNRQPLESWRSTAYCRKLARNVMAMATGDAPAEVATELPEIVKTIQEAWDKVEDKYAVSSLAVAVVIALWGSTGMISAIDRLPVVPGVLELVGIGYTGWFAYRNLVFKPDREALIAKIKSTYSEIIGSSY